MVKGLTVPAIPKTNKMLKILEPMTFPKANSFCPFLAATTLVTNSGKEVPTAQLLIQLKILLNHGLSEQHQKLVKLILWHQRQQLLLQRQFQLLRL